jgi:hypothetical protein
MMGCKVTKVIEMFKMLVIPDNIVNWIVLPYNAVMGIYCKGNKMPFSLFAEMLAKWDF